MGGMYTCLRNSMHEWYVHRRIRINVGRAEHVAKVAACLYIYIYIYVYIYIYIYTLHIEKFCRRSSF